MTLSDETAALMADVRAAGGKAFHEGTVAEGRSAVAAFFDLPNPAPEMARTESHHVSIAGGRVEVLVLTPPGPVVGRILFCHGGGWVCGTAAGHLPVAAQLAAATGCIVAVPDYRLAPEFPFPVPLDDCAAALDWFAGQGQGPLFVAGDSAGGNIAAVLAHRAASGHGPALAGQVLVYPVTDTDTTRPSYLEPDNQQILTKADMDWFIGHYAPDRTTRRDPRVAPLHSASFKGLAPACIVLAGHDPLQDEGRAYARRLVDEGIAVDTLVFPGDIHGFLVLGGALKSTHSMLAQVGDWVRKQSAGAQVRRPSP